MKTVSHRIRRVTVLLFFLANLSVSTASTVKQIYEDNPDSSIIRIVHGTTDVHSLPTDLVKILRLHHVTLTWDNSKPQKQLKTLEELEFNFCELDPNSINFSESFVTLELFGTRFINGTLGDLLKSASHLRTLTLLHMSEDDLAGIESKPKPSVHLERLQDLTIKYSNINPNSMTFSDSLSSLTLAGVFFRNGTLVDLLKSVTNLKYLEMKFMYEVDVTKLMFPPFQIFHDKLLTLKLHKTLFSNGTLEDVMNTAVNNRRSERQILNPDILKKKDVPLKLKLDVLMELTGLQDLTLDVLRKTTRLQTLVLEDCGKLDLSKIMLKPNPNKFLNNLTDFTISKTKLVHGTLFDLLKNARKLRSLQIKNMGELDISNWHYNKSDNSSLQFFSLPEHCTSLHIENTQLTNGSLNDVLKNVKSLQNLTIDGIDEVDFSNGRGLNNSFVELFGKLKYLRISNITTMYSTTIHYSAVSVPFSSYQFQFLTTTTSIEFQFQFHYSETESSSSLSSSS